VRAGTRGAHSAYAQKCRPDCFREVGQHTGRGIVSGWREPSIDPTVSHCAIYVSGRSPTRSLRRRATTWDFTFSSAQQTGQATQLGRMSVSPKPAIASPPSRFSLSRTAN
jgi:hypothetical protein